MNINKCRNGQYKQAHCVYKMIHKNANGKIEDEGCSLHRCDYYNIYPEHKDDGEVIFQERMLTPSVFKFGTNIIWESDTPNNHGMTYNINRSDQHTNNLYHTVNLIKPTSSAIGIDDVCDIMGDNNLTMVSRGWSDKKFYAIPRVEHCNLQIYGMYNKGADMVIPKCLKNYSSIIKGWKTYAGEEYKRKEFYIEGATIKEIINYCVGYFGKKVGNRIAEVCLAIRDGEYINIKSILKGNDVDDDKIRNFMSNTSLRTLRSLYTQNMNMHKYYMLYSTIDNMRWEKGELVKRIDKSVARTYKSNLINYILNYPNLRTPSSKEKYPPDRRYWYVGMIIRKAVEEKIMNKSMMIPDWLYFYVKSTGKDKYSFVLFNELYHWDDAPENVKDDYIYSIFYNMKGPKDMYPGMEKIENVIDIDKTMFIWIAFKEILHAGEKWNMCEIQSAWDRFQLAWIHNNPKIFWNWVHSVFTSKNNSRYGEGNISEAKEFASNLIDKMEDEDTFATLKISNNRYFNEERRANNNERNTFWNELNRISKLDNTLDEDEYEELYNSYNSSLLGE